MFELMTADHFRRLALGFSGAVESSHMNHPDFRVGGKVFASLGYPDKGWAMVNVTPEEQQSLLENAPQAFQPCNGVWGKRGATNVHLAAVKAAQAKAALKAAHANVQAKIRKAKR